MHSTSSAIVHLKPICVILWSHQEFSVHSGHLINNKTVQLYCSLEEYSPGADRDGRKNRSHGDSPQKWLSVRKEAGLGLLKCTVLLDISDPTPGNVLQQPLSPDNEFSLSLQQNSEDIGPLREPWSSPAPCQLSHVRLSLQPPGSTSSHKFTSVVGKASSTSDFNKI